MNRVSQLVATACVAAGLGFLAGRYSPAQNTHGYGTPQPHAQAAPAPSGIGVQPAPAAPQAAPHAQAASGVQALNLLRTAINTHGKQAQACLVFSSPLAAGEDTRPADFLRIEPAASVSYQVSGADICIAGLSFGKTYTLTVRAGLRGADGSRTLADEALPLSLGDLPASADFADDGFILPRDGAAGLPIATVNTPLVRLRVDRITDRVLVRTQMGAGYADNSEYDPDTGTPTDTLGVPLWQGDLTVRGGRNERVVTAFPVADVLGPRLPGAYRITIVRSRKGYRGGDNEDPVYRWIFDTDLMLTTHRGGDGLHVFVRSLHSAQPVQGATVSLIAFNNDELDHLATNANGEAVFAPGLLRGVHGHVPRMVMAYQGNDFTALQIDKPGFDFSDRGVDGRADPGPVDGFLYTDRGIYRPGETIDLTTLVRGRLAEVLPADQAVSVSLRRPDGVAVGQWRLGLNEVGAASQLIALQPSAPRGTWRLEETLAGSTALIGALSLQVQDFVPNRLAVDLSPQSPRILPGTPTVIAVTSRFLYGAPAANLEVAAHVQLQRDTAPVAEKSWQFGRAGETLNTEAQDIAGPRTDAKGQSAITIDAAHLKLPQTSFPLRADITVSVAEPGGRATESRVALPVVTKPVLLGLRPPNAEGELNEGQAASVAVAAFAPDGTHLARRVAFRLIEQVTNYHYFREGTRWEWKTSSFDRPVTFGSVDVPAGESGAPVNLPALSWGTYRLEVQDSESGAFSSVILHSGFSPASDAADSPEKVAVSLTSPSPLPGGTATLHIKPPFAGQLLVTVENDRVLAVQTAAIPESGADITVHADAGWGVGAYVMASVYRPAAQAAGHAPIRAVGLSYVKLDVSPRTIGVALAAPAVLRPRTHFDLPVHISGAAAQGRVWLTLAAVDEGILQLTRFASPDPEAHFFGKRRLAVDVRDDYAKLIDASGATPGEIRAGGDIDGAGLSVVPTKTTALYSGLLQVGADGNVSVPIDLPDFNGGLRLMAVAVSAAGFGHADALVPVRDPVVAQLSLPRFLAPGDAAQMTLLAHNVEAPAGAYHVHIETTGAIAGPAIDDTIQLAAHQASVKTYRLAGGEVGVGQVTMQLTGPDNLRIPHDWHIEVRSPFQSITNLQTASLAPGATARFGRELLNGLRPQGATAKLAYSTVGDIDLPGLLTSLSDYPFTCSEQTVSRAMALLLTQDVAATALGVSAQDVHASVQNAVDTLLERQDDGGAFGLWRAGDGQAEPFLGGQIIDFLTQARARGYTVPEAAIARSRHALDDMQGDQWMLHRFWSPVAFTAAGEGGDENEPMVLAGRAYAALLSARAGGADISDVRYLHDTELPKMEPLSQAQLAVALGILGDQSRAQHAFDTAEAGLPIEDSRLVNRQGDFYRTRLRDTAAMVGLAQELNDQKRVERLLAALNRFDTRPDQLTTQEQGWLSISAGVMLVHSGSVTISVNGAAQTPAPIVALRRDAAALTTGVAVTNAGKGAVAQSIAVRGLPLSAPLPSASHVTISKTITDGDGKPVDLQHLRQNARLVVHLAGKVDDTAYHQMMLVDPLPAGFEIERIVAPSQKDTGNGLPWLGDITPPRSAEKRDDRFIAAIDLRRGSTDDDGHWVVGSSGFNVAYVVRVVSPGHFVLPAASIRDMYRADVAARGWVGSVNVE